jgi:two-component system sensor histidine kinase QseC
VLAWGASSVWLYRSAVAEVDRLYDAALVETAHAVLAVADRDVKRMRPERRGRDRDDDDEHEIELARIDRAHAEHLFYQVRRRARADIAYRSPGAPLAPLAAPDASGFGNTSIDGRAFRVFTLRAGDDGAVIHVGQPLADRARLSRSSALRLVLPGVVLVLLLALGTGVVVRRVTQPIVAFSGAIDARDAGDGTPVAHASLPRELQPVGLAVNRLLARVEDALRHERTLTADAAHELRTPLAALRAQAQVALRATGPAQRTEALRALIAGVDRATHLVGAVLTLAKLDARHLDVAALAQVDLADLARLVADEFGVAAAQRGLALQRVTVPCRIHADADALAVLLRNLLDNALRHARTTVEVRIERKDDDVLLQVGDDGKGLTGEQAQRVFDRFYRAGDEAGGAGLGLALVKRIADLHRARVSVRARAGGGALFEVVFPGAATRVPADKAGQLEP